MNSKTSPEAQLRAENAGLRARLEKAEAALRAEGLSAEDGADFTVRDADGRPERTMAVIQDITDRKRMAEANEALLLSSLRQQEKLREREHFLQRIADVTPGILYAFDLEKQCNVFINRTVATMIGYGAEEIAAMGDTVVPTLMHPDDLAHFPAHLERVGALRADECADFEYRMRDRAGEWRWFHSRDAAFARDAAGAVSQMIGTAIEITARKEAEDELRDSREFTRRVLDNLFAFVGVLTVDGTLVEVNRAPLEGAGISASDVLGKKFWDCSWWSYSPEVQARLRAACKRAIAGEVVRYDELVRMAGEAMLWIDFQLAPLRDAEGRITHLIPSGMDITERRRSAETLRQNAELFIRLVDQAPTGMYVVDADFRLQQVNALAAPVFAKVERLIGRDFAEVMEVLWGPAVGAEVARIFRHTLATGERYVSPSFIYERHDIGGEQAYEWQTQRVTLADGRYGVVCYFDDVTERQRAERAIRESEERLALGTEVAELALIEVDYTTGRDQLTARAARLFGLGDAAVALPRAEVHATFHPEDREELERRIAQCLDPAGRGWFAMEHRIVRPGGEVRWLSVRKQVFFTGEGAARRPARAVLAALDVTAEKTAAEAVRASEERLRALTLAMPHLVWTCSREGDCIFQSPQWEKVTGQSAAASLGYGWLERVHPDDRERSADVWQSAVAGRRMYEADYRLRCQDGTYRWFLARAEPLSDPSGEPRYWIGTSTDIHDAKQTAEKLRLAAEEIARASRAKDDFLAALSHELRTPLTPVLMTATALSSDPTLSPEVRDQLAMMRRNVELEARLIDDLLDLTRISRGKLTLAAHAADVHQLIEHTADIVRSDTLGKQVGVTFALKAARHHALVDTTRIQQVFWNLIKNALKFTPTGGGITVSTRDDAEGGLIVSVADNGIGISAEALPLIFRAFEQGDVSGLHRYGGLGLGLAISHAIVEAHGGAIRAESAGVGCGATFTVSLATVAAPAASADARSAPVPSARSLRLLVVEDHEATRTVLTRLLTRAGHAVTTAGTMQEALVSYAATPYDAVVSDLGLPDGSGLDLMREIQRIRPVPAIALSGYGMEDDVRLTREAGFFAHLVKPVNVDQLKQLLARIPAPGEQA